MNCTLHYSWRQRFRRDSDCSPDEHGTHRILLVCPLPVEGEPSASGLKGHPPCQDCVWHHCGGSCGLGTHLTEVGAWDRALLSAWCQARHWKLLDAGVRRV